MTQRDQIAQAIWPHLAGDRPAPSEQPRPADPLAAAMYPNLAPKKPPPNVRTALNKIGRPQAAHFNAGMIKQDPNRRR
jgi:hypothetical protein